MIRNIGAGVALALCLAVWPGAATAQNKITLDFGGEGKREIWFGKDLPVEKPSTLESSAPRVEVPLDTAKPEDKVFAWDRTTGNIAVKEIKQIAAVWKVAEADYRWIGLVKVQLLSGGKPVSTASIKLIDSKRTQTQLIDSGNNGTAEFYCVAPGLVKVETTYRLMGRTGAPTKVSAELPLDRDDADPTVAVALPEGVETVGTKEEPKPPAEAKPEPRPKKLIVNQPNRFFGVLFLILFMVAAAAGIYFLILWMRRNEDDVKKRLAKLGVQVPEPPEPDDMASSPAVPVAPQPPQKIILDDAATAVPSTAAVAGSLSPTPSAPRLVAESGTVFPLAEGTNTVGREGNHQILLAGESTVSRRHAEILRQGAVVTVKDLGSTNGTFVNCVKITGETPLSVGDTVQFGMVRLRFEV